MTRIGIGLLLLTFPLAGGTLPAAAQGGWKWPDKAANLQVLPRDTPPDKLRDIMRGFSRSLGVRCWHCHVGSEGQPLSAFDFASDANPKKKVARQMVEMLGAINRDWLAKVDPGGAPRVNMGCLTCHAGRARPTTLAEELGQALEKDGVKAALERYRKLRDGYYGRGGYDFGPSSLREVGEELLGKDRAADAVVVYRLNAEHNPTDAGVWQDLAEAYLKLGQPELGEVFLRKALEVDPDWQPALARLRGLAAKPPAPAAAPAATPGGGAGK